MKKFIIATRGSKLALWQSNHIKNELEKKFDGLSVELKIFKTKGDKILDTPLALIGGKGLFTKELEDAMLKGDAHIAVHSLKDVPTILPDGLILGAITKREDPRDAILSQEYTSIEDLPPNAVVGTTSLRRRMQILHIRPDLKIKDLRGNVDTRIKKLKNKEFDAIILAYAGLKRLGLLDEVKYITPIDEEIMIPAMGQAALGIECIKDDEVLNIVKSLNDEKSEIETTIERDFVDTLQGGCQVPIGVKATLLENGDIITRAVIGLPNGKELLKDKIYGTKENYKELGKELADSMIEAGAKELLKRAEEIAFKD
ncbi:hydroxymethylbilane synthase [Nitrosophilus kaiyonis]|uniref:hydroxymethylbilane synthase n=1 Tax=Nitrosophilus kaiyonis TaxID=2930200 RepID=UPI00248F6D4A|nr:hydroxymethylbilane synthase [Nitrosophilus kaiyonis]